MDNRYSTAECFSDRISGSNVGRHVLGVVFRSPQRPIKCVQHDQRRLCRITLNGRYQFFVVCRQIESDGLKIEWHWPFTLDRESLPECLSASLDSGLSLKGTIDNRSLLDFPITIRPTKSNVHCKIKYPK